jgi:hypothetical protein
MKSEEFNKKAAEAGPFLRRISDFVWGPAVNFENMWNVRVSDILPLHHSSSTSRWFHCYNWTCADPDDVPGP